MNTFIATAEAVSLVGATPVFVDVDPASYLMDTSGIEKVVTERTKAVIPVHLYGQCVDMDIVLAIARRHDIVVIEDACQAHGARYKGRRAGSMGHAAAFSFYPGKNLGAWGEGGGITTSDGDIAQSLREIKSHGEIKRYHHQRVGGNFRMDEIQGIVLGVKLKYLDQWNEARDAHAKAYIKAFSQKEGITLPHVQENSVPVWHLFVVQVDNRDKVKEQLAAAGVGAGIHYPYPLHTTDAYAHLRYVVGDFPVAESVQKKILSLPMFPELTVEQIDSVVACLVSCL